MIRRLMSLLFLVAMASKSWAQYPTYFNYSIENGAPSNEVYSILQDHQGFIWMGSDAGLFRYNGVKFEQFTSPALTSRAVTGLCQTKSGTIYAYNFNGQILTFHNNKLCVLEGWNRSVNNLATDQNNNVWVSSGTGLFCISDATKKWREIRDHYSKTSHPLKHYISSVRVQKSGLVSFMQEGNLIEFNEQSKRVFSISTDASTVPVFITDAPENPWAFRMIDGIYFFRKEGEYLKGQNKQLSALLKFRKITNAQQIGNDIWISTHSGMIRYNRKTAVSTLYYPQMAFSSCLLDREGNYWFTTLHDGVLRIPNLNFLCWNAQTGAVQSDQFSHVLSTNGKVYFASTDGIVGEINATNLQCSAPSNPLKSDVGALYFDPIEKCLFYNKMNTVFKYCNGVSTVVSEHTRPIKDFYRLKKNYLLATSQGTYLYSLPEDGLKEQECILHDWSRAIISSPFNDHLFIAGNNGFYEFGWKDNQLVRLKTYCSNRQITDVCSYGKKLYLLTFDGLVYQFDQGGKLQLLLTCSNAFQATQLDIKHGKMVIATNKGLVVYDLKSKQKWTITKYQGLASNYVSGITFTANYCWLATGNGIHRISLKATQSPQRTGKIFLRKLLVNGQQKNSQSLRHLHYNDNLSLVLDGLSYRSNGNMSFAYRFIGDQTDWMKVPASVDPLTIPRLPVGERVLEIKLIDHEYMDSFNTIRLVLMVDPPIWQRWWFYLLLTLSVGVVSYFIFKKRLSILRIRQEQRLQQLRLENELRLTQQSALKAQMNPHFLFNVLNSIKGYIYENDKKNAAKYLSDFSNLVRKVLELSALPTTSLADEMETVKLYINLESMLFQDDFVVDIHTDEHLDIGAILIPSLLLQPYVENAFKHGLRHKKGEKSLRISVSKEEKDDVLVIQITDNGVGRNASERINKNNLNEHTSFATSATQKRIELLNFEKQGIIGVTIQDLYASSGEAAGTHVTIRIHLA